MTRVLFLCTANSARSILSEALLNHYGNGIFTARSAGSFPSGKVNKVALSTLKKRGIPTRNLHSKSWDAMTGEAFDIVITVCDNAAGEICPIFPGAPLKAHWGVADPASATGSKKDIAEAFDHACDILERRIQMLIHLPMEQMSKEELKQKLDLIGTI